MNDAVTQTFATNGQDWRNPELTPIVERLRELLTGVSEPGGLHDWHLPAFFDRLPFALFITDTQGRFIFANRAALEFFGRRSIAELRGKGLDAFFGGQALEELQAMQAALWRGDARLKDVELERPGSSTRQGWMSLVGTRVADAAGRLAGVVWFGRDITGRRRAEFLRRGHAALLEQIARGYPLDAILDGLVRLAEAQLEDIHVSILFYDEENGCLRHGAAPSLPETYTRKIDGVKIGDNVGSCGTAAFRREPAFVADIETDPRWSGYAGLALAFGLRSCWSTPIIDASGTLFGTVALYSETVREPNGMEMEITAMATDLAAIAIARSRAEERIRHMANHDALTGLANRRHFMAAFAQAIAEARKGDRSLIVAYFDLDGFKEINDTLGHGAGDQVLREVAERLMHNVRADDLVARLGGDEFATVMTCGPEEEAQLLARLEGLRSELARPVRFEGRTILCGGSMGLAIFPGDGETPDALLARADAGMYAAKRSARRMRAREPRRRFF